MTKFKRKQQNTWWVILVGVVIYKNGWIYFMGVDSVFFYQIMILGYGLILAHLAKYWSVFKQVAFSRLFVYMIILYELYGFLISLYFDYIYYMYYSIPFGIWKTFSILLSIGIIFAFDGMQNK